MNIYQIKEKLSASSYIVMGLVGTVVAVVMLILYISTNVNGISTIKTIDIVIDSIKYEKTMKESSLSDIDIWSGGKLYWTEGYDVDNIKIMSNIKQGELVTLKFGNSGEFTSITHNGTLIYELQDTMWSDVIQMILMGAVFGFIAYWGARTMRR